MLSVIKVINEQIKNFYLIRRLSFYEIKSQNKNTYLGMLWEILNPMIQISVYAFVFGIGIRGGSKVEGVVPFFSWLIAGISVWFFINQSIIQGSKSIYSRIKIISKMNFPMSVIPTYVIISKFYSHMMLLIVVIIILFFNGFPITLPIIQLPYFMFATIILLVAISLITSTLSTIVRDVQMVIQSLMRILLYLSPILWNLEESKFFQEHLYARVIMHLNPFYYIIEGYRSALLGYPSWYALNNLLYTGYFWTLVIFLLVVGSTMHVKFRDRFVDFL
jgi:teichoic acid transport system permease protein